MESERPPKVHQNKTNSPIGRYMTQIQPQEKGFYLIRYET